jgi:hypothetical protein
MTAPQHASDQVRAGLLFENERVRVRDLRLAPGESTRPHRHTADYLSAVIGDGRLQSVDAEGRRQPVREMRDGEVHFRAVDGEAVHDAVNAGTGPWRNIVELLETGGLDEEAIRKIQEQVAALRQVTERLGGEGLAAYASTDRTGPASPRRRGAARRRFAAGRAAIRQAAAKSVEKTPRKLSPGLRNEKSRGSGFVATDRCKAGCV